MILRNLFLLSCLGAVTHTAGQSLKAYVLVVNKGSNTVSVLDPVGKKQVKNITVGHAPHELTVAMHSRLAYVANYGLPGYGNSISVIDVVAGKEIKRISTGGLYRPHCIVRQGNWLYFTSEATRSIARYDIIKDSIDWISGTGQEGGHMVVVSPGGNKVFVANRVSNTVTAVDVDAHQWPGAIRHIATGSKPEAIDISPDGKELWVGNAGDGTIDIIDTELLKIKKSIKAGKTPIRLQFARDGKQVLVSDNGNDALIVFDATSRSMIKTIPAPGAPMGILVAPDNLKAFVACGNAGVVRILDLITLSFTGSIPAQLSPDGIAWAAFE